MTNCTVTCSFEVGEEFFDAALWLASRQGVVHGIHTEMFLGFGEFFFKQGTSLPRLIDETNEILQSAHALRAHLALPFSPDHTFRCVIPSIQIMISQGDISAVSLGSSESEVQSNAKQFLTDLSLVQEPNLEITHSATLKQFPDGLGYTSMVDQALIQMDQLEIDKVVLARSIELSLDSALDPAEVLARMAEREPSCTLYAVGLSGSTRIVGASPELLIAKAGADVKSNPLAGTLSLDDNLDPALLGESLKDLNEHALVVDDIVERLTPYTSTISAPDHPSIVSLRSVAHLGTQISAVASPEDSHVLTIIEAIHPTPAIGGVPREAAFELLNELEPFDRGFFGGAFGWFDGNGDGEFVLGIRGVLIDGLTVSVAAGAGIVRGSSPDGERRETLAKLQSILGATIPSSEAILQT